MAVRFAGTVLLLAAPAAAQWATSEGAQFNAAFEPGAPNSQLRVGLSAASGPAFLWMVAHGDSLGPHASWYPVGLGLLADGTGSSGLTVPNTALLGLGELRARALFLENGELVQTTSASFGLDEEPLGDPVDFDWGLGAQPLPKGTVVSDVQPWSQFMTVSAVNANPAHPSKVVLFDSKNPGGIDTDLATPGTGPGNYQELGMLLVIAADDTDANGDELVDVPDAEDAGGVIAFDFVGPSTVYALHLVDVDEGPAVIRWYDADGPAGQDVVPAGADNSVYITAGQFGATRAEVELAGSAGIGLMTVYGCETVINFDTLSTGGPVGHEAGTDMTAGLASNELLGGLGLFFFAQNANPEHPDQAVLFDSEHPSGEDFDLATPGPGAGNDEPLANVLILSEDDTDANGDGLVDDPDDEAAGGVVVLGWYTSSGRFKGATLVDVDSDENSWIEVIYDDGSGVEVIPIPTPGNNSVQTIDADVGPTRQVEFHLGGSTAIAEIRICPEY